MTLGTYSAVSLPLLDLLRRLYLAVVPLGISPFAAAASKVPVVLLGLIVPTLCIGAVFPLVVRLYTRGNETLGGDLSLIYAFDTLGAAVGALLAGFILVPRLGLLVSTLLLGAMVLLQGAALVKDGRTSAGPRQDPSPPRSRRQAPSGATERPLPPGREAAILWTAFATGAAALLLETGWNRFFYVLNGTSVFSNSVVLAGFLGGLGASLGSHPGVLRRRARSSQTGRDPLAVAAAARAASR